MNDSANPLPIRTLGHGLDAIIVFTRQPRRWWERLLRLRAPELRKLTWTAEERLVRYFAAAVLYPFSTNPVSVDLRFLQGFQFRNAWTAAFRGGRPIPQLRNLRDARRLRLVSSG